MQAAVSGEYALSGLGVRVSGMWIIRTSWSPSKKSPF
jgi:hypothetical protein